MEFIAYAKPDFIAQLMDVEEQQVASPKLLRDATSGTNYICII